LIAMQKRDLRLHYLAIAKARPLEEVARASLVIEAQLGGMPAYRAAQVLALYQAMPSEPATRRLIDEALLSGKQVVLPTFGSTEPQLGVFQSWEQLVPGPLGIAQPTGPVVPVERVDFILVPGLAFDRRGFRLGRGKGYYDRLLAKRSPKSVICGVCFDDVLIEELPHDAHDVPMDLVLTPAGLQTVAIR
jgi:5-formyltetrahydrofolate cyclo-ligase